MAKIYRRVFDFQPPHAAKNTNGDEHIDCTRMDLCRSIVTVGNPSFISWKTIRDYGFGRALLDSVVSKVILVLTNIRDDGTNLRRHNIFDRHVSDQKRIVSYNLGMAFGKLYAEKLFDIPTLVHVEFLKKQGAISFAVTGPGRRSREPDLVGTDLGGLWHVFEAKGVSGSESQLKQKIKETKQQLSQVLAIHGNAPETRTACATYIGSDRIYSHIADPPSEIERKIEISSDKFLDTYYSPFFAAIDANIGISSRSRKIDGISVEFFEIDRDSHRFKIGLESEVYELMRDRDFEYSLSLRNKLKDYSKRISRHYSIGLDGFFFGA